MGGDGADADADKVKPPEELLKVEAFRDFEKDSRVRRLQHQYQLMAKYAEEHGTTIDHVIQQNGYRDFHQFNKTCERFKITCRPIELAELGSGFVLYFQFLKFLALLLFVMLLAGIPAMTKYSQQDALDSWPQSTDVADEDKCKCLGPEKLTGLKRPFERLPPGYGESCGAWDVDVCRDLFETASRVPPDSAWTQIGRWCCRSWCYADAACPVTPLHEIEHLPSPSLANRFYGNGPTAVVRATTTCNQELDLPSISATCRKLADMAFDPKGIYKPSRSMISWIFFTPGNFGPHGAENCKVILFSYLGCTVIFAVLIVGMFAHQQYTDKWIEQHTTLPAGFTVMVKGLPKNVTEQQVVSFFTKNAVKGKEVEIAKVVIGWDVVEYHKLEGELNVLKKRLQQKHDKTRGFGRLGTRMPGAGGMEMATSAMSSSAPMDVTTMTARKNELHQILNLRLPSEHLTCVGAAVVTFRYQSDKKDCLKRWNGFWSRRYYYEPGDCFGLFHGDLLPRLPDAASGRACKLKVVPTANPGDINWEHLAFRNRLRSIFLSTSVLIVVLGVSFGIVAALTVLQKQLTEKAQKVDELDALRRGQMFAFALVPACVIVGINHLLKFSANKLAMREEHDTVSERQVSEALKATICLVANSAGILFCLNARSKDWYKSGGLVESVFWTLLLDAFFSRLLFVIDLGYIRDVWKRRSITQAKLDEWNEELQANFPPRSEAQLEAVEDVKCKVEAAKLMFRPPEMDTACRYSRALSTTIVCILYAPVFPWAPIIGIMGLGFQYWLDKVLLLRWYRRSNPKTAAQAQWSLQFVRLVVPMGFACALLIFLPPSWKDPNEITAIATPCLGVAVVLWLPIELLESLLLYKCCVACVLRCMYRKADPTQRKSFGKVGEITKDYYTAQYMWPKGRRYHTDHFAYRNLPKYLNPEILKPGGEDPNPLARAKGKVLDLAAQESVVKALESAMSAAKSQETSKEDPNPLARAKGKVLDVAAQESVVKVLASAMSAAKSQETSKEEQPFGKAHTSPTKSKLEPTQQVEGDAMAKASSASPHVGYVSMEESVAEDATDSGRSPDVKHKRTKTSGSKAGTLPKTSSSKGSRNKTVKPVAIAVSMAQTATSKSGVAQRSSADKTTGGWQFSTAKGWKSFESEAQREIEEAFVSFSAGGGPASIIVVLETALSILVDFPTSTQKALPEGKTRKIRRLDAE